MIPALQKQSPREESVNHLLQRSPACERGSGLEPKDFLPWETPPLRAQWEALLGAWGGSQALPLC